MSLDPLTAALDIGGKLIDRLWQDPAKKAQAQIALLELAQRGGLAELAARSKAVTTEAASKHWLAANWRPMTMVVFTVLIVSRWFGWTAPNLSEAEYLKLWDIVEFGLGGYVVGRSVEKISPGLFEAIKSLKGGK